MYTETTLYYLVQIDIARISSYLPGCRYTKSSKLGPIIECIINDSDNYNCVLCFAFNKYSTTISSSYSSKELQIMFLSLPKELQEQISDLLANTNLKFGQVTNSEVKEFNAKQEYNDLANKVVDEVRSIGPTNITSLSPEVERIKHVYQHTVAYTTCNDQNNILYTFGAGPCIILAMYNPLLSTAGLAHIDANTPIHSVRNTLSRMSCHFTYAMDIHLAGSDLSTKLQLYDIIRMIKELKIFFIKSSDISDNFSEGKNLGISACTGGITRDLYVNNIDEKEFKMYKFNRYETGEPVRFV